MKPKTLLQIIDLSNEPNIVNEIDAETTFCIMSDMSEWGQGKNHLLSSKEKTSKTLCGVRLGFNYETGMDENFKFMNNVTKDKVISIQNFICKRCLTSFNKLI